MCNTPILVCIRVYSWFTCCERLPFFLFGALAKMIEGRLWILVKIVGVRRVALRGSVFGRHEVLRLRPFGPALKMTEWGNYELLIFWGLYAGLWPLPPTAGEGKTITNYELLITNFLFCWAGEGNNY